MRRPEFIARQSRRPSGLLGRLIGRIMESETAPENDLVIGYLALRPSDHVLEVGFGSGRTLERVGDIVGAGHASGIDASDDMLATATRRCRRFIERGCMDLRVGTVETLPFSDATFDKAFSVHTLYFWERPARGIAELRRVLTPGGRLVLGFREKGDPHAAAFPPSIYQFHDADDVAELLGGRGFSDVTVDRRAAAERRLAIVTGVS
jgi:arsenite methyltransferase